MRTVEEIQTAVQQMTIEERDQLRDWFQAFEDDDWDRAIAIAADVAVGKLDKSAKEAARICVKAAARNCDAQGAKAVLAKI